MGSGKDNGSTRLRVDYDSFYSRSACAPRTPSLFEAKSRLASPHLRVWPLKLVSVLVLVLTIGIGNVRGANVTGTINFGSASGSLNINSTSVNGKDSKSNTWTVTTAGTTSFSPNADYAQVGSSKKPATSITFTTTLPSEQTITAMSAKFGGFSGTAGTVTLKVGDNKIGKGSLNAATDVIVESNDGTKSGTVLTVTVTGISKGVKCYYISYTYSTGGGGGCSECMYYVYNGSKWVSIGTTGFNDVVLAPPTMPGNNHGAGNGCWTTDKNVFTSCIKYASGEKFRYVPNPGGAAPTSVNKPGNGTCELYAVYFDESGCLSTTVTAVQCARIWEKPKPNTPSVSGSDVTLSWSSVAGASGYHLYVTDGDSDVFDGDVNSTSKTLTGLAGGAYMWTVAANSSGGDACDSNPADGDLFEIVGCTDISGSTVTGVSVTPSKVGGSATWTAVANASSYEVKVYAGTATSGSALFSAEPTSNSCTITGLNASTQYTVVVKAKNSCSTSNQGKATWTTSALTLYTVTFVNQSGTAVSPAKQTIEGGSVTLPSASPSAACAALGWTFAGWKDGAAQADTTDTPTLIAAGSYIPSENKTFYAVFTKTEGGGGGVGFLNYTEVTSAPSDWSGNYLLYDGTHLATGSYASNALTWETADAPGSTEMSAKEFTLTKITYNSTTYYTLQNASGKYIGVTSSNRSKTNLVSANSASTTYYYWTPSTSYILNLGATRYLGNNATSAFKAYVTSNTSTNTPAKLYKRNEGSVGTTYWNSNPSCSSDATVTYHNDGAKSGAAPTDANSPYTIGAQVTVLGTGTMVAPDGKVFKCWNTAADGTGTDYNIDAKFEIAGNMDFYPKWVNLPYTVTFDAEGGTCGTSSLTEASGGAGVTLPAATATCAPAGWSFYGWATSTCSSTTSAPSIVGTTGETYYPTGNITLHAVYKEGGYAIGNGSFTQVTGTANVVDGNFYLITNVNNANGMMYNTVTSAPRIGSTTNSYASCDDINCAWQMKKNGDCWQIYSPNKNLYAAGTGVASRATLMSDGTDDKTMWTLETTGAGYYKFKNKYNTAQRVDAYLAYSAGYGYACMAANGTRDVLYLYKADYGSIVAGTTTYNSNPTCVTYEITIGNHTNGTVTINGTTDSPQESLANQKITLSATPESGYRFTSWTITKTTGGNDVTSTLLGANATTASTSFTMPDYDVTVSATFAAKVMYSITWNVNGSTYATGDPSTSAESGTKWSALTLPTAPADNTLSDCDRTKFVGWSTSPLFGDGHSAPSDLFKSTSDDNADSHTITEATTFYAVFAKGSGDFSFGWESADEASIWTISGFCNKETYTDYKKTGSYAGSIQGNSGYIQLKDKISPTSISCQYTKATSNTNSSSKFIIQTSSNGLDWTDQATGKTMNNVTQGTFYELKWTGSLNDVYVRVYYTGTNATRVLDDVVISGGSFTDYATQCCTLKPVTNLAVSSKTANSVTLTWTAPSPTTGIDHLELRNASTDAKIGSNIAVGTTTTTVGALTECETYTYKIVSVGDVCETPSNIVEATPFGGSKTVTFNYNGGTGTPASFTTSCGGTSTILPTPTRDGYTFLGWWTTADGGSKVGDAGANYDVATTTTIHAHWAQNFTVTYDLNGGAADPICSGGTYYVGQSVTVCSTTPTKTSSSFLGWKRLDTDAIVVGGSTFTMPSNNVTIQAQWETVYFHIYYKEEDGTAIATDDVPQTAETTLRNQTPCVGYTFFGWSTSKITSETTNKPAIIGKGGASYTPDADITVYPVYARSEGATTVKDTLTSTCIGSGSGYRSFTNFQHHSDAKYSGWAAVGNTSIQMSDACGIVTTTSGGKLKHVTIKYHYKTGADRSVDLYGQNSNYSNVTEAMSSTPTGSKIGTAKKTEAVNTAQTFELPSSGNDFDTEYEDFAIKCTYGAAYVEQVIVTWGTGTYYYATHCNTKENVTVTYNGNGGTVGCGSPADGAITSVTWDYKNSGADAPTLASAQTICASATRSGGYVLRDWTTGADGTGTHYTPGASITSLANDITLYAQWDRVYTVTFNDQGAITSRTQASGGSTVAVPSNPTPCNTKPGVTWTFAGWGTVSPLSQSLAGHIIIPSGTNTYTPTEDVTLYAVYRKELGASDAFAIGTSGAYKISAKYSNGTKTCYASTKGSGLYNCSVNAGDASTFYLNYVKSGTYAGKYTLQNSAGEYIGWSSGTTLSFSEETPAYYTVTQSGDGWLLRMDGVTGSARYFTHESSTIAYNFKAYTEANPVYFTPAAAAYYYTTMSCDDDFSITFHANGGTITWNMPLHGEGTYQHLADGTEIDVFPTATFDGWTFLGWQSANYDESTTVPEPSTIYGGSDGESGNPFTIHSNTDMYPIFTRFEDNEPFDQINGGDYYIYFLESGSDDGYGGEKRVYATGYSSDKRYNSTSVCSEATTFTFTKLGNGNWTIYDNTTKKYLYGASGGDDLKQKDVSSGAEWTLTVNGNQFDAFHVGTSYGQILASGNGTSATFMNYSRDNLRSNPGLYHRVYLGGCTNRTFTTYPSTTPNIEIHGQVKVTSTADKSIKAASVLTVSATNIATANLTLTSDNSAFKFSLTSNGTYTASVNIPVVSNKVGVTPIYVEYTPTLTTDGIEEATITVSDGASPTPTTATTESGDVQGRHLPTDFVIAAKIGNNWYALPADCSTSTSSTAGVLIEVDEPSDPTRATGAPMNTKYGLQPVRPSRVGSYGNRFVFTEHLSTQITDNQKTLYNGAATSIQVNAMYANYMDTNQDQYEWIPTTTDLKDYTLTSAKTFDGDASARTVSLNTSGVFGTLLQAKAYNGKVRLLPATFYEPAEVQILKWKTNSVIVMYTGTEDATTKVGENAASGSQALESHKLSHGIYEFTTNQALTANAGQTLRITLGSSRLEVEIPLIIAGNTTAAANGKDVVILDGATFTAAATKYSYRNVYVYGGGKLDIPSGTSLGVNNIILRAGGITTSGIGSTPAATYEYKYPQVKLVGTLTSTQTNIKYEYVTDYDHWYHLCLPFNALTSTIQYPQEYYGSNVAADNHGSWVIKRYDGATRATGNYDAWVDIESNGEPTPTTVTAGNGYIFWGAPKKVSVGGGAATRQAWGIQRITMAITAGDARTAENADKNVTDLAAHSSQAGGVNDQGWNLIGNPYMVNLTGLEGTGLKTGKLIKEMVNGKWTGRWESNNDALRYITVPNNNFETYEAVAVVGSGMTLTAGKAFFVQLDGVANAVRFETSKRALAPAWHRNTEAEQPVDVETGIVMSSETLADEVNFWIKDGKTEAYEFNADYPKTPNKTNFNIYGVHQSGNLSWVAISPAIAEGDMAIGYQVPAAGDYTLSLSEKYIAEEIESVFVTDHGVSPELTTDLMVNTYTFTVHQAETNNERFMVSIKVREEDNIATDIGNNTVDTHAVKFIRDDKMYILRNGLLYDATGKRVNGINK